MHGPDPRDLFRPDAAGLAAGMKQLTAALTEPGSPSGRVLDDDLGPELPAQGADPEAVLRRLGALLLDGGTRLGHPGFFAHMDPPSPWPTWVTHAWSAAMNQNLLHPETSPQARRVEQRVVEWLCAPFGMAAGHLVSGSSSANLTALWAARQRTGARRVLASAASHLSVRKAADILGMAYEEVPTDAAQRLDPAALPADLSDAVVVLTAGTTISGSIDPLDAAPHAAWRHLDAAWAGPLAFSPTHRPLLAGAEEADSVAMSCHKWLFQPKESALVAFRDPASQDAVSYSGPYLAVPNVGLAGTHGGQASAALAATLLSLGSDGLVRLIDDCLASAVRLQELVEAHPDLELWGPQVSGIVVWRPRGVSPDAVRALLDDAWVSLATLDGERWFKSVAANPWAEPARVVDAVLQAASDVRGSTDQTVSGQA